MLIYFLLLTSIVFLFLNYIFAEKDFFNPSVIFCLVNVISTVLCAAVSNIYRIDIHLNTYLVLTSGLLIFTVVNMFQHYLINNRLSSYNPSMSVGSIQYISIQLIWILLFIVLEIIVAFSMLRYEQAVVKAYYGQTSDIVSTIGQYNRIIKNHFDESLTLGIHSNLFVSYGQWIVTAGGIILAGIGINNYYACGKKEFRVFLPVFLMVVISFLSGSRSNAFRYLTAILAEFVILRRWATGQIFRGSLKLIIRLSGILLLLGIVFWESLSLLGRSTNYVWYEYLLAYVGGPIYNLDSFLSKPFTQYSLFGHETFRSFYNMIGARFHIPSLRYPLNLPYLRYDGHFMGNVYTMYYMYIEDFGYWGIFPLTLIVALYYNYAYTKYMNRRSTKPVLSVGMFIFCFLFNDLIMLLFSNRFYENVIRDRSVRYYIFVIIIWYLVKKGFFSRRIRVK